jgi:ribosomal protection tetracycline resistance protein
VRILNLGILAHVDAGKTTLSERLLYEAGIIDQPGSVDKGSTRTDSLPLERRRGITIKSAVVSFPIGGVSVNLIDTPGHPDFIAEVERALRVLDGVVLVLSAVEGVQAQTLVLFRTLRRLQVPTILFVNKIDRGGARYEKLLRDISGKLAHEIIPMGSVSGLGTRDARFIPYGAAEAGFTDRLANLAADNESLLSAYLNDEAGVHYPRLRRELAEQTSRAMAYPVFFGSAATGAGVPAMMAALTELLPEAVGDPNSPVSGLVFKVERDRTGAKVAYVRMISGTVRVRDRLRFSEGEECKVTAIDIVEGSSDVRRTTLSAGEIGKLRGAGAARIGDVIGVSPTARGERHLFSPPTLEAVVVPSSHGDRRALYAALGQMADQDPLINLRRDGLNGELLVSLYGEVQKEVIQATLAEDYGIDIAFRQTMTIYAERVVGTGVAGEVLGEEPNPYLATLELRVQPAPVGAGVDVRLEVPVQSIPMYVYRTVGEFLGSLTNNVRKTFRQGLYGWEVSDCLVTVTRCGYSSPGTTAADFRKLLPLVLMSALKRAATVVCEPVNRFYLEGPRDAFGPVQGALPKFAASADSHEVRDSSFILTGLIPAARVRELEQALPALTGGEGILESSFDHYRPIHGAFPNRPRWDDNPLDREEYLLRVERRVGTG